MAKVQMSLHRALSELKTYDSRINNALSEKFVISNKRSNEKIGSKTIDEVREMLKGNLKSSRTLIENRKIIKSALVAKNASEEADINNKTYTLADAIERKNAIVYEEKLLASLKRQYLSENNKMETSNDMIPNKLEMYLQSVLGTKDQRSQKEVEEHTKAFETKHTVELIDPNKVQDVIKELEEEILAFKNEVDYVLSEKNATTFIEVDLLD